MAENQRPGSGFDADESVESYSESGSEFSADSPPVSRLSMTAGSFFSKKRQRCSSASHSGQPQSEESRLNRAESKRKKGHLSTDIPVRESTSTPKRIISRDTPRSQPCNLLSTPTCSSNGENTGLESASSEDEGPSVKLALREITSLLNTVVKRVERVETELKKQSESIASSSRLSSSDSSTPAKKRIVAVPLIVRSEVRKMFQTLLDEEYEGFHGFDVGIGCKFDSQANKEVVAVLLKEVQQANPQFQACQIRAAAYTYYRSLNQEESLKRRGKQEERKKVRRRRERLLRKLQERQATLKKCTIGEKEKEKWNKVMTAEMMSSEESNGEDDVVIVQPLPWRSGRVTRFFKELDQAGIDSKTSQAKRQRKERVMGSVESMRPMPSVSLPSWAFTSSANTTA